jgi:aminoglycoside phosphotransferase (APT) family kinase protein
MEGRPYGHDTEAAVIEAARVRGVTAPEVVAVLEPEDGIGSGFVMRALPGTPNPKDILAMEDAAGLLKQVARDLARIHSLRPGDLPDDVPVMDYREAIADLRRQFEEAGGDRPIIALGLKWMEDNCPDPCEPVLNHGDYRMGNILAEDSRLTGVLDWELAHFGDPHEDIAFGCMAVWRFHRYDRPALGLGSLEDYFAAYEAESGRTVDRERFRYWLVHRTVWWAMGCLRSAKVWRDGSDRMLERVVISRRTSEQELDLLMLLEEDVPQAERARRLPARKDMAHAPAGDASVAEIATAVSEWLSSVKHRMEGHDRFQLAVARNALGIIAREEELDFSGVDAKDLAAYFLSGDESLKAKGLLAKLRFDALEMVGVDSPKYPALAHARKKWTGEE